MHDGRQLDCFDCLDGTPVPEVACELQGRAHVGEDDRDRGPELDPEWVDAVAQR